MIEALKLSITRLADILRSNQLLKHDIIILSVDVSARLKVAIHLKYLLKFVRSAEGFLKTKLMDMLHSYCVTSSRVY